MDNESIEKKLKYELELLKVYSIFTLAIGTGTIGLILHNNLTENKNELILFVLGIIGLIIFAVAGTSSFIRIKRLYKKL